MHEATLNARLVSAGLPIYGWRLDRQPGPGAERQPCTR
jgi:hypothetical protein